MTSEVDDIDALIDRARTFPAMQRMQWVVVTDKSEHRDLARCMQSCALASVLKSPWTVPLLAGQAYSTMVRFLSGCGYSQRQIRNLIADPPPFAVQGPLLEAWTATSMRSSWSSSPALNACSVSGLGSLSPRGYSW